MLLALVLGAGDLARLGYHAITLTHAARAGASYGGQTVGHSTDGNGIRAAAEAEAANIGSITVTSQQVCECGGTAVSCGQATCSGYGALLAYLEVSVNADFTTLVPYPGIPTTVPVTRTARTRVQ